MADGYGIDQIEAQIQQMINNGYGFDPSKLSDSVQELMKYIEKIYDRVAKDPKQLSDKEINSAMKEIRDLLKSSGATTKQTATYMSVWTNELKGLVKSGIQINKERFQHSANANISNMTQLGVLDTDKRGAQNNILATLLKQGYTSTNKSIDDFRDKVLYFLNQEKGQEKTKKRQFVEDLVEGLARSKFVGGAFTDIIRLITFFAGSWLKDKGPLGKALTVGLIALGPVIATAIFNSISKAMTNVVSKVLGNIWTWAIDKLVKAIAGSKVFNGLIAALMGTNVAGGIVGKIGGFFAGRATQTAISTAAPALMTGFGSALSGTAAAGTAAGVTGATAIGGLGAAGGAAAGGAAAAGGGLMAILGPVLAIAAGVALIGVAIWAIWKNWDKIKEWSKEKLEEETKAWKEHPIYSLLTTFLGPLGIWFRRKAASDSEFSKQLHDMGSSIKSAFKAVGDWFKDLTDTIRNVFKNPFDYISDAIDNFTEDHPIVAQALGLDSIKKIVEKGPSNAGIETDEETGVMRVGKLKIGTYGEVLNARELSQGENKRYLERYRDIAPDMFNNVYEVVGSNYASMVDFRNDLRMKGTDGKEGAVLFKGATDYLKGLRERLVAAGMSQSEADKLVYTSGMSSKTSGHARGGSHDSPFGYGYDLVGKGWSQEQRLFADKIIKDYAAENYGKADFEYIDKQGKTHFGDPSQGSKNAHWHANARSKAPWYKGLINESQIMAKKATIATFKTKEPEEERKEDTQVTESNSYSTPISQGANQYATPIENKNGRIQARNTLEIDYPASGKTSRVLSGALDARDYCPTQRG